MPDIDSLLLLEGQGTPQAPPPPPATPQSGTGRPAERPLLVRNLRTTELVAEIHEYRDLHYKRRSPEAGEFELTIDRTSAMPEWLAPGMLLEVRREGVVDFVGAIESGEYDAVAEVWRLRGPDLLGFFLGRRGAGVGASAETYTDSAETVAKAFVQNNGGVGAAAARRFTAELSSGIQFGVEASSARGESVEFSALRRNLLTQTLIPICKAGNILQHVHMTVGSGYEYRVTEPVDGTVEGSDNLPFAVSSSNVSALTYRFDQAAVRNAMYIAGPGTGDARNVESVVDSDSVSAHFRREGFEDARDAASSEAQIQLGQTVIAESLAARVSAEAQPLFVDGRGSRYREDYDLGWDVTLALPEVGVTGIVRRIVEVQVSLNAQGGEEITVALGSPPRTFGRLVSEGLRRSALAAVG